MPPVKRPQSPARIVAATMLCTLSALVLWSLFFLTAGSRIYEARAQHELYARMRNELALATAPTGGVIPMGAPVALIDAPTAGLKGAVVSEGTTSGVTRSGPGHLRTSPLPGQPGVSLIYGRAMTFGAPFAHLDDLKVGDRVTATTAQGTFTFKVADLRHGGDKWTPAQNGQAGITLVSSEGGVAPKKLLYVDAVLDGKTVATPSGQPTSLGAGESTMAADHNPVVWMAVVLWLQLLLLTACGLIWLRWRWSAWQSWLVAAPLLLAVLWGLSVSAARLLPNVV
jgi:sortase A